MCEGRFFIQVKNRLKTSCQVYRAGPAPTQPLKASSDGAVTVETGREFQRRIVEGKEGALVGIQGAVRCQESGPVASGYCAGMN